MAFEAEHEHLPGGSPINPLKDDIRPSENNLVLVKPAKDLVVGPR
jgi:hypothetical protein